MSVAVFLKLLAIFVIAFAGWVIGRLKWLGPPEVDPAKTLSNAAFYLFVPALLFRTTARLEGDADAAMEGGAVAVLQRAAADHADELGGVEILDVRERRPCRPSRRQGIGFRFLKTWRRVGIFWALYGDAFLDGWCATY